MSSDATDLGALAGTADEVLRRLTPFADRYTRSDREDVAGALTEAERQMRAAVRQIERAARLLR
jgi:ElaB/YqjD/DUF883 family membrane-anchored ribosome-binding protein